MKPGQVYPDQYDALLTEKVDWLTDLLKDNTSLTPEVFPSLPEHYRMRAEFRVWHEEDDSFYIMFDPTTKEKVRVDEFPVGNLLINQLMTSIRKEFLNNQELRYRLFQVEFLTSQTGQALVSLIYHRKLGDEWIEIAKELETKLGIHIIGRSRKQRIVVSQDFVTESFNVAGDTYQFEQQENSFTQPNAHVCQIMLNWAQEKAKELEGDLLELYCGNGNFTLPLSKQFNKVLATEISKASIRSANANKDKNGITNIQFARMSCEDFSSAWLSDNTKLKEKYQIQDYSFTTLFVDPPRAGLDNDTLELARNFESIIYISCNPVTLKENLTNLGDQYEVTELALFDQFPYTHHVEAGVVLKRRQ